MPITIKKQHDKTDTPSDASEKERTKHADRTSGEEEAKQAAYDVKLTEPHHKEEKEDAVKRAGALRVRLECAGCGASSTTDDSVMKGSVSEESTRLIQDVADFVERYAEGIIENSAPPGVSKAVMAEIKNSMTKLDPFVAGNLILDWDYIAPHILAHESSIKGSGGAGSASTTSEVTLAEIRNSLTKLDLTAFHASDGATKESGSGGAGSSSATSDTAGRSGETAEAGNGDDYARASAALIARLDRLNPKIASALLYETWCTGNAALTTEERLFTKEAREFLDKLGSEAASEWLNSAGSTGKFDVLTDKRVMSEAVLDVIGGDAKIASELSYALGITGDVNALTDDRFLYSLKSLNKSEIADLLSGIWYTRSTDTLTNTEIISKISSSELNVWTDIARVYNKEHSTGEHARVIISKLGGAGHDRGAKLIAQSLADSGFDVIYVSNVKSAEEVIDIAAREGVSAIGFSLMDNSYKHIITDVSKQIKTSGMGGVSIFSGGYIEQQTAEALQQASVKMFGQGTTKDDLVNFLNAAASQYLQQHAHILASAHSLTAGTHAGDASTGVHAPIAASVQSKGSGSAQSSASARGQTTANAYLRYERNAAAISMSDLGLDSNKIKKVASASDSGTFRAYDVINNANMSGSSLATSNLLVVRAPLSHAMQATIAGLPSESIRAANAGQNNIAATQTTVSLTRQSQSTPLLLFIPRADLTGSKHTSTTIESIFGGSRSARSPSVHGMFDLNTENLIAGEPSLKSQHRKIPANTLSQSVIKRRIIARGRSKISLPAFLIRKLFKRSASVSENLHFRRPEKYTKSIGC